MAEYRLHCMKESGNAYKAALMLQLSGCDWAPVWVDYFNGETGIGRGGGFVLPGDHVDIVLTRTIEKGSATTEVVLQNTKVLAVDQSADDRANKAAVAKSVTLEVDTVDAQKLWLASSVGSLSLLLRNAGETAEVRTRKITLQDLGTNEPTHTDKGATTTVVVTRASAKQEYTVPAEQSHGASAAAERRQNAW